MKRNDDISGWGDEGDEIPANLMTSPKMHVKIGHKGGKRSFNVKSFVNELSPTYEIEEEEYNEMMSPIVQKRRKSKRVSPLRKSKVLLPSVFPAFAHI